MSLPAISEESGDRFSRLSGEVEIITGVQVALKQNLKEEKRRNRVCF